MKTGHIGSTVKPATPSLALGSTPPAQELRQYPDGEDYYIPSKVTMSGKNKMSIFTDYLSSGTATENFVRISY